jgi:hypothetical protein
MFSELEASLTFFAPSLRRHQIMLPHVGRLFLIVAFVVSSPAAFAQQDRCAHKFVSFPRNGSSVSLKGRLKGKGCLVYRLNAREGQTMTVHLVGQGAEFHVSYDPGVCCTPEGSIGGGVGDWSGELPATGHYDISVTPAGKGSGAPYTLEITIR